SWRDWRDGGHGTRSGGKSEWHFPTLTELKYPTRVKSLRGWDDWIRVMNLDRRMTDRTRRVLTVLATFFNLKTGQCSPRVRFLAMIAGLGEDESAEVMARQALTSGEGNGWIKRHYRGGGRKRNRSTEYELTIPAAVHRPSENRGNILAES